MSQENKEKMVVVKKSNKFWMGVVAASSMAIGALGGATLAGVSNSSASQAIAGQTKNNTQQGRQMDQAPQMGDQNTQQDQGHPRGNMRQGDALQDGMPPMNGQGDPEQGNFEDGSEYNQDNNRQMPPRRGEQDGNFAQRQGGPSRPSQGQQGNSKQSKPKPSNADGTTKENKNSSSTDKNNTKS